MPKFDVYFKIDFSKFLEFLQTNLIVPRSKIAVAFVPALHALVLSISDSFAKILQLRETLHGCSQVKYVKRNAIEKCKAKTIQVDSCPFRYIQAYSDIFRHNQDLLRKFRILVYLEPWHTQSLRQIRITSIFIALAYWEPEAYLELCQVSAIELFAKIISAYNYLSDYNWTRSQNNLVRKQTLNHFGQTGWMFVYKLSGSGFESICSHLNFSFRACFEQGVPWHSGKYRVQIHSETYTWHDANIQSYNYFHKLNLFAQYQLFMFFFWNKSHEIF